VLISSRSVSQHGRHRQFLFLVGWFLRNLLLCNHWAILIGTWKEASFEGPLWRMLIYFRSVNKHGRHRQFLFLIGWFLKNLFLCNHLGKWIEIWQEASLEGPLLIKLFYFRSVSKHGRHRQFLFLIGWFLKNRLLWNRFSK
jgi:hypothetical protein